MDADKFPAGMRVLAVDDDRTCLRIIERQLQHCEYDVTTAMRGEVALEMLRARKDGDNQFKLVITDVHMPGMDGLQLLELIGLEIDVPVIMLSANDGMETMMRGIEHGACDYLVKPVRLEQIKSLWMHVVRRSKTNPRNRINGELDDAGQNEQSGDAEGHEMDAKNKTRKSWKKKNDGEGTDGDKESTPRAKRQRIRWSAPLHRKFVEVIDQIGMDRAVPKKILEKMNVNGLSREIIASHLQKYRIYLKKVSLGTFNFSNPFADGPWSKGEPVNINGLGSVTHNLEHGRYQPPASFSGTSSSSNPLARMGSTLAFGTHSLHPTQPVQLMSGQRNLGIPRKDKGLVIHNSLFKDAVQGSRQDASQFISFGNSHLFPSGPSGSSFANSSSATMFNISESFPSGTSGNSLANISNNSQSQVKSTGLPSSSSYASILRGKILGAARGIPFDADDSFEDIADGGMLAPSSRLSVQSPELVNQPPVQMQPSSADLFNNVVTVAPRFTGLSSGKTVMPSDFRDLGHKDGTSGGPSQGNNLMINQFSGLAASSGQMPNFGNGFQNQMAVVTREQTTTVVGFDELVAQFNLGGNTSSTAMLNNNCALGSASSMIATLPNLQIDSSVIPTQMLNGEGASGNLPDNDIRVDQQALGDQQNNNNDSLVGTSEAHVMSYDLDEFFADFDDDLFVNDDAFMDGDWEFAP